MADTQPSPVFREGSLDDLMRMAYGYILKNGTKVVATRGQTLEVTGALLELTNPRARFSRTHSRGKAFSCLGELIWYLSGSDDTSFITYYIKDYEKEDFNGKIPDAYGPRFFKMRDNDQIANIVSLLGRKPTTRRAVVQLFNAEDLASDELSAPCTCNFQFLRRGDQLDLITYMRSNDALLGLPHDIFCFTMLQEIIASTLNINLGVYKHFVGSFHLYEDRLSDVHAFLEEGWQRLDEMPEMPRANLWPQIQYLIEFEKSIRNDEKFNDATFDQLDSYWRDIVLLLKAFKARRGLDRKKMESIKKELTSRSYDIFLNSRIDPPYQGSLWPSFGEASNDKEEVD